jgi:D-alanyl-D-alanine-carboxypeptidase/D-alanyl-D-alanine-endopeptidase
MNLRFVRCFLLPGLVSLLSMLSLLPVLSSIGMAQSAGSSGKASPASSETLLPVYGVWLGTLHAGAQTLRLQFRLKPGARGGAQCALDSLDQNGFDIPCNNVKLIGDTLTLDVPAVHASYGGVLSVDGGKLNGVWTQGASIAMTLERKTTAIEAPKGSTPAFDRAMPAVGVAGLKAVLDRDLEIALKSGALAPETHAGVTVGVMQHGVERIFSYGTAKPDSVFEIGSITKTFTGLLLAQMVEQGTVKLDQPVRELLPEGTVGKPESDGKPDAGGEITLLDLSDQHAGLPPMPDNFKPGDPNNPYADYDTKLLYEFISKHGVAHSKDAPFVYSNLGVGLLGQALAEKAKLPYATLLREQITGPLKMHETAIALTPEMRPRMIEGHDADGRVVHGWDLDALAGAGGIRSTAADMLIYLDAQLHPDRVEAGATMRDAKTLPDAIEMTHVVRADVGGGFHIGLGWFRVDATGSFWHNGGTGGYTAYALFNPAKDYALVVLSNAGPSADALADNLGQHIEQRLTGMPAISLAKEGPSVVEVDAKVLAGYVGTYELAPGHDITVTLEGDQLFGSTGGPQTFRIFAESEKKFFLKVVDAQIVFETDDQGKTIGLTLHQNGADHEAKRVK